MSDDQKNDQRFALVQQQQQGIIQTASAAASERARAEIIARFQFARLSPRSMEEAYARLMKECQRSGFARVARFCVPRGKKQNPETGRWEQNFIEGWSIRFMEAAARALGNIDIDARVTYEDDDRRHVTVTVTDLEANTTNRAEVVIPKTIERRKVYEDQEVIGTRQNSEGKTVYVVRAPEGDLVMSQNAQAAKARRTLIQALIPGDFLDDAFERIRTTLQSEVDIDPDAARKKLVLAFAELGVSASALASYLGAEVSAISPAQLVSLRKIYVSIKDGETTWREVAAQAAPEAKTEEKKPTRTEKAKAAAERATKSTAVETTAEPVAEPTPSAPHFDPSTGEVEDEEAEEARARAIEARLKGEA